MREGLWINYKTGKTFRVYEHEQWLRENGNAKKLGVPNQIIKAFKEFRPGTDRDKFLLYNEARSRHACERPRNVGFLRVQFA